MNSQRVVMIARTVLIVLMAGMTIAGCHSGNDAVPGTYLLGGNVQGQTVPLSTKVTTFSGHLGVGSQDGFGQEATFEEPYGITTDGTFLYVTDKDSDRVRRINIATAEVTTLVQPITWGDPLSEPVGITTDGSYLYVCDSSNNAIDRVNISDGTVELFAGASDGSSGSSDGIGDAARFWDPYGITTDGTYLYVADRRNHIIRRIEISTRTVTTMAGTANSSGSDDGTGTAARFDEPMSIATDGTYLYIGDWNNFTIRRVSIASGEVTTMAGRVGVPGDTDGVGTAATFYGPRGLATDGVNLYVADYYAQHGGVPIPEEPSRSASLIRKVSLKTGEVTTIAGYKGEYGHADDPDGTTSFSQFYGPAGITTDGVSLYIAERFNYDIRRIH